MLEWQGGGTSRVAGWGNAPCWLNGQKFFREIFVLLAKGSRFCRWPPVAWLVANQDGTPRQAPGGGGEPCQPRYQNQAQTMSRPPPRPAAPSLLPRLAAPRLVPCSRVVRSWRGGGAWACRVCWVSRERE